MLGDGEAEEVLQEAFLSVAQSADRYVANGQFRSWLLRIVRNRCLNRLEEHQQGRIVVDGVELTNDLKQIEAILTLLLGFAQKNPEMLSEAGLPLSNLAFGEALRYARGDRSSTS